MSLCRIALLLIGALAAAPLSSAPGAEAKPKEACIRAETPALGRLLAQSAPGMIELGRGARMVRLTPVCVEGSSLTLAQRVIATSSRRRFLLVIDDLRAEAQPGVLFDLKLADAMEHAAGGESGALLGTLNFYAAQRPGVAARPRMVSYDVTETLRGLAARGRLSDGLVLAIQPIEAPAQGSDAAIGRIALVEQ